MLNILDSKTQRNICTKETEEYITGNNNREQYQKRVYSLKILHVVGLISTYSSSALYCISCNIMCNSVHAHIVLK